MASDRHTVARLAGSGTLVSRHAAAVDHRADIARGSAVAPLPVLIRRLARGCAWLTYPLVTLLLAACADASSRPDASAPTSGPAAPPVSVTWSFWGDDWAVSVNRRLIAAFERQHSDIRVQVIHRPWREYFDWLRAEWQAGRSPDVMFLNLIPAYVPLGELEPLDRYVARDALDLDDFYPALLEGFRVEGRLYGLPRDNDTKVIYYNRAHFAEAGIAEPRDTWMWEDLRTAARALTRDTAGAPRYGFGFELDFWWLVWLWQNGCGVLDNATAPSTVLLTGETCSGALQFLHDLIHVDHVTPPPAEMTTDAMNRLFREGRLSMMFGNHALVPWFAETAELSWQVAPLPGNVARANVAGGAGFVMSRRAEHKDAAWQLIRFLTGTKAQAMLAESGVITPARRSVREDSIFLRRQPYRAEVFRAESAAGRPIPNFPGAADFNRLMNAGLAPVWRGERSPAETLRDLAARRSRSSMTRSHAEAGCA